MSNPEVQAKAQALMARLEGQERIVIDEIQRLHVRKQAREAYACCVACFDKAGATGPSETLERCVQNCQVPYQQASNILQQVSRNSSSRETTVLPQLHHNCVLHRDLVLILISYFFCVTGSIKLQESSWSFHARLSRQSPRYVESRR
jgi:hypothetical protein